VRLRLGPEDLSPELVRKVVRHGGKDSFDEASADLCEDVRISVTPKQVQRITARVGTEWAAQRDRETKAFREGHLARLYSQPPRVAAVMADGGRIQTRASDAPPGVRDPQWREPKYGCCLTLDTKPIRQDPQPEPPKAFLDAERVARLVAEVQSHGSVPAARTPKGPDRSPGRGKPAPRRVRSKRSRRRRPGRRWPRRPDNNIVPTGPRRRESPDLVRTAVATMRRSDRFGELLAMESYRRSLDLAPRKAYVCDGQAYNWTIWGERFRSSGSVPVLDFVHLLTYVYSAAHAAGGSARRRWERYEQWLRWAWGGERVSLLDALTRVSARLGEPPARATETDPRRLVASARTYVVNNLGKMDYPRYRRLGLPTSSAPVESLVKQFNRRVKGTEKFWTEEGAEAVLEIRAAYLSQDGRADRNWALPRPRYRAVGRNRLALVN
jgi:hypothetical protein